LATDSVTADKLAANSVTAAKIAAGTLTDQVANNSITAAKIVTNAIQTRHIADDQVTGDKLTNNITLAGTLTFGDGHTLGNDGDDNLVLTGSASENIIIDSADDIILDADGGDFIFRDGGTEQARLKAGKLGIGTDDPDALIEIVSSDPRIRLRDDTAGGAADGGGILEFVGYHAGSSDGKREWARITGLKENATGGNTDGYLKFYTNSGSLTERMRITSDGNVGIGGTPQTTVGILDIVGQSNNYNTAPMLTFKTTSTNAANRNWSMGALDINYGDFHIGCGDSNSDFFDATAHSKFTISKDGEVGIGITSPTKALEVSSGGADATTIKASYNSTNYLELAHNRINAVSSGGNDTILLQTAGTTGLTIDVNQKVGIGTTSPTNTLDLGAATLSRGLTFAKYSNLFSEYSNGSLWISSNFYGTAGGSGYKTGATGTYGAAGIRLHATGGGSYSGQMEFYVDPQTSKTADDAFTPTQRMRINSYGNVDVGAAAGSWTTKGGLVLANGPFVQANAYGDNVYQGQGSNDTLKDTVDSSWSAVFSSSVVSNWSTVELIVPTSDNDDSYGSFAVRGMVSGYDGVGCHFTANAYHNSGVYTKRTHIIDSDGGTWTITISNNSQQGFKVKAQNTANLTHPVAHFTVINGGNTASGRGYNLNNATVDWS
jgi:hypothetical protein